MSTRWPFKTIKRKEVIHLDCIEKVRVYISSLKNLDGG